MLKLNYLELHCSTHDFLDRKEDFSERICRGFIWISSLLLCQEHHWDSFINSNRTNHNYSSLLCPGTESGGWELLWIFLHLIKSDILCFFTWLPFRHYLHFTWILQQSFFPDTHATQHYGRILRERWSDSCLVLLASVSLSCKVRSWEPCVITVWGLWEKKPKYSEPHRVSWL